MESNAVIEGNFTQLKYMMTRYKLSRREARKVLRCKRIAKKIYKKEFRKLASDKIKLIALRKFGELEHPPVLLNELM